MSHRGFKESLAIVANKHHIAKVDITFGRGQMVPCLRFCEASMGDSLSVFGASNFGSSVFVEGVMQLSGALQVTGAAL
eukprot:2551921-Amphidinium_carterae.1